MGKNVKFREFIDWFSQGQNLKVLGYGYNNVTNTGWVEVIEDPPKDDSKTMRLYTSGE